MKKKKLLIAIQNKNIKLGYKIQLASFENQCKLN